MAYGLPHITFLNLALTVCVCVCVPVAVVGVLGGRGQVVGVSVDGAAVQAVVEVLQHKLFDALSIGGQNAHTHKMVDTK